MTEPSLVDTIIGLGLLFFLIAAPTLAVCFKNTAGAAVLAAVGAAALIFTRLPDISDFHLFALGVKLERQSREVEVTLQQLQKLAASVAKENLAQLAVSVQLLEHFGTDTKFRLHDQIIDSLRAINVPSSEISDIQEPWIKVYCEIFLEIIRERISILIPNSQAREEIEKLPRDPTLNLPRPDVLREWTRDKALNDADLTKLLDAYASVWTTGTTKDTQLIPFNQSYRKPWSN